MNPIQFVNLFKSVPFIGTATAEDIHREFETAGDKLLAGARKILADATLTVPDKAKRLRAAGFSSVPEIKQHEGKEARMREAAKLAEVIEKHRTENPRHKFITQGMVDEICKKYNLVTGPASIYKGFVPERNLREIEMFRVDHQGARIGRLTPYIQRNGETYVVSLDGCKEEKDDRFVFIRSDGCQLQIESQNYNGLHWYGDWNVLGVGIVSGRIEMFGLMICAPLRDMNVDDHKLVGNKLVRVWPDPVVLWPVEVGYLIVTSWGAESEDPIMQK